MPERDQSFKRRGFARHDTLTALSPLDGRYFKETAPLREYGSELAIMAARVEIEARYLIALCDYGVLDRTLTPQERRRLLNMGPRLSIRDGRRIKELEESPGGTDHDLQSAVFWMKEKFKGTSLEDLSEIIHLGLTSEDVDNLALRLNVQRATDNVYIPSIVGVAHDIFSKARAYKGLPIMGRTHGQDALPVTFGHEFAVFGERIADEIVKLKAHKMKGKLNGAVGVFSAHTAIFPDVDWIDFSRKFVESLGFEFKLATTQTNPYEDLIERLQIVQRITNIVHDLDQDMWRYISDDWLAQEVIKSATGSSTMAQKVNPIKFENSEGHAELASGNVSIFVERLPESRLQRDLSDSSLRRYIIPNVYGAALIAYINALRGLSRVYPDTDAVDVNLNSNWAVMSEWVQQRLRVAGFENAYLTVKDKVRGVTISSYEDWENIIRGLPIEDDALIQELLSKTPSNYLGKSREITEITVERGLQRLGLEAAIRELLK